MYENGEGIYQTSILSKRGKERALVFVFLILSCCNYYYYYLCRKIYLLTLYQ